MRLALAVLGDEGGSGQRSFSSGWIFCICDAQQGLGSCLTIAFFGKKMSKSLFLNQIGDFYESCRNVVFQTSAPLPNLVEVPDEPKSCEGTQTPVDRVIT